MTTSNTTGDLTIIRLVFRRLKTDWRIMSSVFAGIVLATFLMSATPVYLDALERQSIHNAVNTAVARGGPESLGIKTFLDFVPIRADELDRTDSAHDRVIVDNAGPLYLGTHRHLQTPFYSMILSFDRSPQSAGDRHAEEEREQGEEAKRAEGPEVAQGFLHYFEGLDDHVVFIDGGMNANTVTRGTFGPMIEALISKRTAEAFGDIAPGDVVVVSPSPNSPLKLSARISGIVDAADPDDAYWQSESDRFLYPRIPSDEGVVTANSPPALGLFVERDAMSDALSITFPDATVDSTWYSAVDPAVLRTWSRDQMQSSMDTLQDDMNIALPDSFSFSGIEIMLARFGRQSFLNSVPLLLLLAVLGVAVLYFLFMIVSYLAPNRESDVALFRSRGTGTWQLLQLYLGEGVAMAMAATLIAPFLALGAVWLAGLLPYFSNISDGGTLPVRVGWLPFAAAGVAALLCLVIFAAPGALGARSGLTLYHLRSSRPPTAPLVQRYYIDILFLAVAGVLFWELQTRGELVSGGLFGQRDVNEALLIAPALFLLTIGLLFFRVFSMFIRYISGEAMTLIHVSVAVTLPVLVGSLSVSALREGDTAAIVPIAIALGGFAASYWLSTKSDNENNGWMRKTVWIAAQTAFVAWFLWMRPPDPEVSGEVFVGTVALIALVPAQVLFHMLAILYRRAPVWVSMSMWHMARNPLQYSWIVLLMVLVAGIGILAATVGATLDRSYEERIQYAVGMDIRVYDLESFMGRRDGRIYTTFGDVEGVESVAEAFRGRGRIGAGDLGPSFSLLAVDIERFHPWYRSDFSEKPLAQILPRLRTVDPAEPLELPADADMIRMRVKPTEFYPLVFLWVVLEDANGRSDTVTMGELDSASWTQVSAEIPEQLERPLKIVSIQLNEPGFGSTGTVGSVIFDDLEAVNTSSDEVTPLEGFDDSLEWVPIATTSIGSDEVVRITEGAFSGNGAALFTFGKDTNRGIRGIYRTGGNGYIPAVASEDFIAASGAPPGTGLLINLQSGIVPVVIVDRVEHFPTMIPGSAGFLIFDIQSLLAYTDRLNSSGNESANELFLKTLPGAAMNTLEQIDRLIYARGSAIGVEEELAAQAADPLTSAGWRAAVLVAIAVVLFMAALGYIVYLLAFADSSVGEMGALRSLGLSRMQTVWLIALEHMLIALIGLGVGTWAGFQMSSMVVSSVAVADGGGRLLPPFILTTNWMLAGTLYAALLVTFIVSLLTLGGRVLSLDLRRLSRMEG